MNFYRKPYAYRVKIYRCHVSSRGPLFGKSLFSSVLLKYFNLIRSVALLKVFCANWNNCHVSFVSVPENWKRYSELVTDKSNINSFDFHHWIIKGNSNYRKKGDSRVCGYRLGNTEFRNAKEILTDLYKEALRASRFRQMKIRSPFDIVPPS